MLFGVNACEWPRVRRDAPFVEHYAIEWEPMRSRLSTALAILVLLATAVAAAERRTPGLPPGFVYLGDVDASIGQDIRYATAKNFTHRIVEGYEAPTCILTESTARALAAVQRELTRRDPALTLKVYDCYRPARAVRHFRAWVEERGKGHSRDYNHPSIARKDLITSGYIAGRSLHSRGNAVDLTIARRDSIQDPRTNAAVAPSCAAPASAREPDTSLDMGTSFDCFEPASQTHSSRVPDEARRGRNLLLELMSQQGFRNYRKEWWHFSYPRGDGGAYFDFAVRASTKTSHTKDER